MNHAPTDRPHRAWRRRTQENECEHASPNRRSHNHLTLKDARVHAPFRAHLSLNLRGSSLGRNRIGAGGDRE